jgi:hypothetical protein
VAYFGDKFNGQSLSQNVQWANKLVWRDYIYYPDKLYDFYCWTRPTHNLFSASEFHIKHKGEITPGAAFDVWLLRYHYDQENNYCSYKESETHQEIPKIGLTKYLKQLIDHKLFNLNFEGVKV